MRPSPSPAFDHGAAIRVPPAHDRKGWQALTAWLGDCGAMSGRPGVVNVSTPVGITPAAPGDWIVLSVNGVYHVARSGRRDEDV
jgi:hypothetical protein